MKSNSGIQLADVQAVYGGPEFQLWELVMGRQIHIGGLHSSNRLADVAELPSGASGVDLCCCTGEGMRFLVRLRDVAKMHGVDATEAMVQLGRKRCEEEGLTDQIQFTLADATNSGLPDAMADFVWGEDAWCYVVDKDRLVAEAARLVKPGGVVAFTDWIEGPEEMNDDEYQRLLTFMKFPNLQSLDGYAELFEKHGCETLVCEDTDQFAPYMDLYLSMLDMQLTFDALRIIGFDSQMFQAVAGEMVFMQELAHDGKIAQGRFVAKKKG